MLLDQHEADKPQSRVGSKGSYVKDKLAQALVIAAMGS